MIDGASFAKLQLICPRLAEKVKLLAEMQELAGQPIKVMDALRSWQSQQTAWLKGRNLNGEVVDPGAVVTYARPGYSQHQFGLAVDVAPFTLLSRPDWHPESPLWEDLGKRGESLGLTWGGRFKHPDRPHFQLTGRFPISPTDEMRHIFLEAGMAQVWIEAGLLT